MSAQHLHDLLDDLVDSREIVVSGRVPRATRVTELFAIWSAARAEANDAYDGWRSQPGREAYAVYRAAEDRADAAEAVLARGSTQRH